MRRALAPPAILLALLALGSAVPARAGKAVDGVVNLNTAPPEVLGLLPGIGPAKAAEIATYRKRRPFRTVDELVRIKGIGRKMVRRLRPHLLHCRQSQRHRRRPKRSRPKRQAIRECGRRPGPRSPIHTRRRCHCFRAASKGVGHRAGSRHGQAGSSDPGPGMGKI